MGDRALLIVVHQDLIVSSRSQWFEHDALLDIRDGGCFVVSHLFNIPRAVQFLFLMLTQQRKQRHGLDCQARRI